MKTMIGTTLLLSIVTIIGIVIIIIGNLIFDGDVTDAFTYLGGGSSALAGVFLAEIYRRQHDLKKATAHRDTTY
jgi:hypothetical protein